MTRSIVGERWPLFWGGCAAIAAGVLLHVPMLGMAHEMGGRVHGMALDPAMYLGMALIALGVPAACWGALPHQRPAHGADARTDFEAAEDTPLNRWQGAVLAVLILGLVIDVMKPATLGFVLPGMAEEYGMSCAATAWLPFVALTGATRAHLLLQRL